MSIITTEMLYEAGLNTDMALGFEMQMKSGKRNRSPLWPEHIKGKRYLDWEKGSTLARFYLAQRTGYAKGRSSQRRKDFREYGATSCILPKGQDRRDEQLRCFNDVMRMFGPLAVHAALTPSAVDGGGK